MKKKKTHLMNLASSSIVLSTRLSSSNRKMNPNEGKLSPGTIRVHERILNAQNQNIQAMYAIGKKIEECRYAV